MRALISGDLNRETHTGDLNRETHTHSHTYSCYSSVAISSQKFGSLTFQSNLTAGAVARKPKAARTGNW
jgi:hypothetical protein